MSSFLYKVNSSHLWLSGVSVDDKILFVTAFNTIVVNVSTYIQPESQDETRWGSIQNHTSYNFVPSMLLQLLRFFFLMLQSPFVSLKTLYNIFLKMVVNRMLESTAKEFSSSVNWPLSFCMEFACLSWALSLCPNTSHLGQGGVMTHVVSVVSVSYWCTSP